METSDIPMETSVILKIGRDFQKSDQWRGCTFDTAKLLCDEIERLSRELELERSKGNGAKLREACKLMLQFDASEEAAENDGLTYQELIAEYADHIEECQKKATAALAEPVKNCEVGTAMEQGERFAEYCHKHKHPDAECLYCPLFGQTGGHCELAWAQMPYEEGGDK